MAGEPEISDDTPDDATAAPFVPPSVDAAADDGDTVSDDADSVTAAIDVDLDEIDRQLAAVDRALARLDDGSYWTDEVTGAAIDDDQLATDPTARRQRDAP